MRKKVVLKFDGKTERQERSLIYSGYRVNHGSRGMSYVKDVDSKTRFHVYPLEFGMEIHMDRTGKNGWHYVAGKQDQGLVVAEARRIMRNYRELRKDYFAERQRLGLRDEALDTKTISILVKKMKSEIG